MMFLRCNFPASRPQAVTKNAPSKIALQRLLTICLKGAGGDLTSRASGHAGLSSHRVGVPSPASIAFNAGWKISSSSFAWISSAAQTELTIARLRRHGVKAW
jgi:hypothetical protein